MSTPTVNKKAHSTTDSTVASLSTTIAATASGDALICFTFWNGTATTDFSSTTDSNGGNSWATKGAYAFGATGLFMAVSGAANANSVTSIVSHFSPSVNFIRNLVMSVSGADTSTPFNAVDGHYNPSPGTGNDAITSQSGTTATTVDGCLIIGCCGNIDSATLTNEGGSPIVFSLVDSQANGGDSDNQLSESGTQTTHGTVAATFTVPGGGGTNRYGAMMIALAGPIASVSIIPHTPPPIYIFS